MQKFKIGGYCEKRVGKAFNPKLRGNQQVSPLTRTRNKFFLEIMYFVVISSVFFFFSHELSAGFGHEALG